MSRLVALFNALFPPEQKGVRQFGWIALAFVGFVVVETIARLIRRWYRRCKR